MLCSQIYRSIDWNCGSFTLSNLTFWWASSLLSDLLLSKFYHCSSTKFPKNIIEIWQQWCHMCYRELLYRIYTFAKFCLNFFLLFLPFLSFFARKFDQQPQTLVKIFNTFLFWTFLVTSSHIFCWGVSVMDFESFHCSKLVFLKWKMTDSFAPSWQEDTTLNATNISSYLTHVTPSLKLSESSVTYSK